jgi:hypothetical protein
MNERLDDLMYSSGLTAQGCWDEMDDYAKQAIEKFAQLIVKECIRLCDEVDLAGADDCIDKIKDNFGVEESKQEKFTQAIKMAFEGGADLSGKETP